MARALVVVLLLVLVLVVLVVVAGTSAYLQFRARQRRVRAVAALAQRVGFTFSRQDVDHLVELPFEFFGRGRKQGVELVISGEHGGVPLRMFDYWYYDETSDAQGNRSRRYRRFTCALATIPAACPRLRVGHENFATRLGERIGLRDVVFEYDDFNRKYRVKCDDQRFAFSLFDGKMMEWLLDADSFDTVEVDGPWILLAAPKLDPAKWLDLGTWIEQFHRKIPAVVYSTYPPR